MKTMQFIDFNYEDAVSQYNDDKYKKINETTIALFHADDVGSGAFSWFPNYEEMREFILNVLPAISTEEQDDEYYNRINEIEKSLSETSNEDLLVVANIASAPFDIRWIGTVDDLISQQNDFTETVRDHYNENQPIDDKADFISFLKDYIWA